MGLSLNFLLIFIAAIPLLGLPGHIFLRPLPDLMLLGVLFTWIYFSIKNKSLFFTSSPLKSWLWGFIAVSAFSGLFAIQTDLWLGNILGLLVGLLFLNIFRVVIKDEKNHQKIIDASLIGAALACFFGLLQLALFAKWLPKWSYFEFLWSQGRLPRLSASFIDPLNFAAYLAIVYPFLLVKTFEENKWYWKVLMLITLFCAIMTQGRSLLAAITVSTVIVAWFLKKYAKPALYFCIALLVILYGLTPENLARIQPQLAKANNTLGRGYDDLYGKKIFLSSSDRQLMLREGKDYLIKNPMGIGAGNSARELPVKYQSQWGKGTPGPHNIFLGFAIELGWLGGIFFLSFMLWILFRLGAILFNMRKQKKWPAHYLSRVAIFASFIGFLVYHQFVDSYTITPNVFYFWILLTLISQIIDKEFSQ